MNFPLIKAYSEESQIRHTFLSLDINGV
ncbi:hypothetical protein [Christiangramia aquimixticola]